MNSSNVDWNTFANCPTIAELRRLVDESKGQKKINRQRSLEASILVADAWQLLVRARQIATAEAIDETGPEVFFSAWNAIAVEMFLKTAPPRKRSSEEAQNDHGGKCDGDRGPSEGERKAIGTAIEKAVSRVTQAWSLLDGLEGEDVTDGEAIRELGIRCFGEARFRAAIVAASVKKLARPDISVDGNESMDCT